MSLEVVAAVICLEGKVLACRRRPDKAAAGMWEFPGGKIEPGEEPEEAIVREIAEELNTSISVVEHLGTDSTLVGEQLIELTCFRASLTGPVPVSSSDHDQLLWITTSELWHLNWATPDIPVVRRLKEDSANRLRSME